MTIANTYKNDIDSVKDKEKFFAWVCRGWGKKYFPRDVEQNIENLQNSKLLVNAPISFIQLIDLWQIKISLEKNLPAFVEDVETIATAETPDLPITKKLVTFGETCYKDIAKEIGVSDYGAKLIGESGEEKFKKAWLYYEEYGVQPFITKAKEAVKEYVELLASIVQHTKDVELLEPLIEDFFVELNSRKYITNRELENIQLSEWIFTVVLAEKLLKCGVDKAKELAYNDLMVNQVSVLKSLQNVYSKLFTKIVNE